MFELCHHISWRRGVLRTFKPVAINFETGEKISRIGYRDGESTTSGDAFLYEDGARRIPFQFFDYMDFGQMRLDMPSAPLIPLSSVMISKIGADLKQEKSHTFHDYFSYDKEPFGDAATHGYTFATEGERAAFEKKIAAFMPLWLFHQLERQHSKSSHALMISREYFPALCVETLFHYPLPPKQTETPPQRILRLGSRYRGPLLEWEGVLRRRQLAGSRIAPGMEKRSPWGGKIVEAIKADCEKARSEAREAAAPFIQAQMARRITTAKQFFELATALEPPHLYEKFTALLLRCEHLPVEPHSWTFPYAEDADPFRTLWTPPGLDMLERIVRAEDWLSREHLLAHLIMLRASRERQRRSYTYEKAARSIAGPEVYWPVQ